jgi:alpha-tubulin suppressor-like RCC1 family protein
MTCAINIDGQTSCYGNDSYGNLGDGGSAKYVLSSASRMGLVLQSEPYVSISTNSDSTCAVGQSGQVYCWGANDYGQLGDGSTKSSSTPVPIKSDRRFSSVSIEGHGACGLTVVGKVLCWGRNTMGLIGDGKVRGGLDWPRSPEQISVDESFISVSTGDDFACAVSTSGDVWCWGASWGNGDPDDLSTSKPFVVRRASGVVQVAAGHLGTCVLATNEIDCWGYFTNNQKNSFRSGLLGIFEGWGLGCSWTATDAVCSTGYYNLIRANPFKVWYQIYFNTAVKKVSGTCALSETGLVKCWKLNSSSTGSNEWNGIIESQTSIFG